MVHQPTAEPAGPTTAIERAPLLDALRGFALFGVCAANLIVAFSHYGLPRGPDPASLPTAATDSAAAFLLDVLVDGKFYSLFSLLFGIGFALQLQRAEARGEGMSRYATRLGVLFLIGLRSGPDPDAHLRARSGATGARVRRGVRARVAHCPRPARARRVLRRPAGWR